MAFTPPTRNELIALQGTNTYIPIVKFAFNNEIDTGIEDDVWSYGGNLSYLTSAETIQVASSSTADTMGLTIVGVDSDYNLISEVITLDGTTTVSTTQQFLRVWRAEIAVDATSVNAGDITGIATLSATVQFYIDAGLGQTEMCHFTVPLGYKALLKYANVSTSINDEATVRVLTSVNGGAFRVKATTHVPETSLNLDFDQQPIIYDEKTDLLVRATSFDNNTKVSISYQLLLVANSEFE